MATDPGIFIRSMASRGHLGGLARATVDAVAILDAARYDKVIVETVGVGQDEVDIVKAADVTVVVLVPGMGDDIQAIKAGIMEIGDVFAINKADREGVLRAERELEMKRAQVAERERRLRAEVRMQAGELLAVQRNLRFTEELLQVNRQALGLIHARVGRGAAPPLEENLLLVEVNRLDASRRLLASRVEVLTLRLKALTGLGPEVPLSLRGDLYPAPLKLDLQAGLAQALKARSDLLVARAEITMAEASILKEKAEGRWDASVNVGYMRQDFSGIFHYVGAGVSIMLPLRNQNQGNIAAAIAGATAAVRRMEFVILTVRQEVTATFTQYEATQRALEIYAQGVREVARQNLEVVRKTYELGRASLLDLIAEQRRYIDIETGYTESLKQVYDAVVDIERTVGMVDH